MLHTCLYPPSFVRRFRAQIEMALRNMENGKATGPDNLPVEVWKSLGRTGVNFLREALNKITDEETIPDIWPPHKIRFQPFPVCHHDGFTDGNIRKEAP